MLTGSSRAIENARSKPSRRPRRLSVEPLESRTLLSAAPWNPAPFDHGSYAEESSELRTVIVEQAHRSLRDPVASPLLAQIAFVGSSHGPDAFSPTPATTAPAMTSPDGPLQFTQSVKPDASPWPATSYQTEPPADESPAVAGPAYGFLPQNHMPADSNPASKTSPGSALDYARATAFPSQAMDPMGGGESADPLAGHHEGLVVPPLLPPMDEAVAGGADRASMEPSPFMDAFHGEFAEGQWGDKPTHEHPPEWKSDGDPRYRDRFALEPSSFLGELGYDLTPSAVDLLTEIGSVDELKTIFSDRLREYVMYNTAGVLSSLAASSYLMSDDLNEGGLIALSSFRSTDAYGVTEPGYEPGSFCSLWNDLVVTAWESDWQDKSVSLLPSLREVVRSSGEEKADGGLIDIDGEVPSLPVSTSDANDSWDSTEQDAWVQFRRDRQAVDSDNGACDEQVAIEDVVASVDAAMTSEWCGESEEGGMIELAVIVPGEDQLPASTVSASDSGRVQIRDIRIDKGLGRFRAFEVAAAPAERGPASDASGQEGESEVAIDATVATEAQKASEAQASVSSVIDAQARADHHAAAPAILFASLLTGIGRPERRADERKKRQVVMPESR